ncbi:GNAT family N-acetyltransferase [Agreia sp. PsM10]|uniref:GNAT family N-acetyltransferase n=1 Tax=Agreia sp. PsM10 TaxID=3030533 RepID=UPI00263BE247|nr:GNAT family N-acetyltransferase [Agreia sp. PsM10]MDN4640394.1 GNAT family N-acetyltransferase [Agreia sp. PsM10]
MEPAIRPAFRHDAEQLVLLSLKVWDEAYGDTLDARALSARHEEPRSAREERWVARIADDEVLVAVDGDELVGFARSRAERQERRELVSLYVRQRCWRSGLGSRLLNTSMRGRSAQLWLFEGNVRALRFYERHGFLLDGRRREDPPYGFELHMVRQ